MDVKEIGVVKKKSPRKKRTSRASRIGSKRYSRVSHSKRNSPVSILTDKNYIFSTQGIAKIGKVNQKL